MVWVAEAFIENRVGRGLQIGEQDLRSGSELGVNSIDGPIPMRWPMLRDMASSEAASVSFEVLLQARIVIEINETLLDPRVNQIATRPICRAVRGVPSLEEWEKAIFFYEVSVVRDVNIVAASGDSDANASLCACILEGRKPGLKITYQGKLRRRPRRPKISPLKPVVQPRCFERVRRDGGKPRSQCPCRQLAGIRLSEITVGLYDRSPRLRPVS